MKIYHFLFLLIGLVFTQALAAQQQVRFDHLSINDGLSQSSVNAFLQDNRGFIWMGTQDGLNRFDGYEFTTFHHDPTNPNSIADNYIHDLTQDAQGKIWIATDNGLSCFTPATQYFENFFIPDIDNTIRTIFIDAEGNVWAGFANAGIGIYNQQAKKFELVQTKINSKRITDIFGASNGDIWVATEGGGVNRVNKKDNSISTFTSRSQANSIPGDIVWRVVEDSKKRLWFATNRGLACLLPEQQERDQPYFVKISPESIGGSIIKTIAEDEKGSLWVGTDGQGLIKLTFLAGDIKSPKIEQYQSDPYIPVSLSNDIVLSIFEDNGGLIWVGSNNGVNRLDPQKQSFAHYRSTANNENSLSDKNVWSILEDDQGILWVGTREGLNRIDQETGKNTVYKNISKTEKFQSNKSVMSLFIDSDSEMWLGTAEGLYKVNLSAGRFPISFERVGFNIQNLDSEIENRVYSITETTGSIIWAGMRYGLLRINKKTGATLFLQQNAETNSGLSDNTIRYVFQQSNGTIWVGTEGGLDKVLTNSDTAVTFAHYRQQSGRPNSISNNMVMTISETKNNILWLGTYGGGLNQFNTKTNDFNKFTERNGLSNNAIYGILQDDANRLWISTNKGISLFDINNGRFSNYYENDGLQSNEFNIGAYYKANDGRMYFGGINGITAFYPQKVAKNSKPPSVVLTGFKLFNKYIQPSEEGPLETHISLANDITLSYKEDNFTIEYAALHYANSKGNKYEYKMIGFDNEWIQADEERSAHYTSLDPGEYTFLVKGSNSDGVWSEEVARLNITILPPYWQTWWFRCLIVLIVIGGVYAVYVTRVSMIKQQKKELEEIVQQRTTEVIHQKEMIELQNKELTEEKDKVEKLLSNILPEETLEELKTRGKTKARSYNKVTVMFVDIVGFTRISEKMRPQELIAKLDSLFIAFDTILEKYTIEKIKTMGDAYMCAAGVPIRNKSNPIDMVLAAMEIQQYMATLKTSDDGEKAWKVRIGIHTGELTAGVVGLKRFSYDIWGDTVNVAKRMESTGVAGKVNISWKTHSYIREFFDFTHRGTVTAKNKGEVDAYFVKRIKPEMSIDRKGIKPNDMFWEYVRLQLYSSINYRKAERYIVKLLRKGLADNLYYHSLNHMRDVCHAAEEIAHEEGVKGEDLFLLKTAALFHDAGFIHQYMNNEPVACEMAREVLPRYGYSKDQLDVIEGLIMATCVPQEPKNKLQEIICDADLDYLGRTDFHPISDSLRREFLAYNVVKDDKQWDEIQIKFLSAHKYFTATAKKLRTKLKLQHLEQVKERYAKDEYKA